MGRILDLIGTSLSKLQIGLSGPFLKNNAGTIESRNAADSAYAAIRASGIFNTGDDIIYNEQSTSTGASWKFKVSRPSSGMTHDLQVIYPSGDPSVGQVLSVASFAANVITLQWSSAASTAACLTTDTTTLAFGSTSPLAMYTAPANAVHEEFQIIIDTPFNGTPTLSIGITGTTSKYVGSTQVDLTAAAGTTFCIAPGVVAPGSTENIIATYSAGGASVGSARIIGCYSVPS